MQPIRFSTALVLVTISIFAGIAPPVQGRYVIDPVVEEEIEVWSDANSIESVDSRVPIIVPSSTGKLVALSEGRRDGSDSSLKFLLIRRSGDNGLTWNPTDVVLEDPMDSPGGLNLGAILTDYTTGKMMVVYSHCAHNCEIPKSYLVESSDEGETWGDPVELNVTQGIRQFSPGPGYGIQKVHEPYKGRLIFCGHGGTISADGVFCICSDDHGKTWKRHIDLPSIPFNHTYIEGELAPDENQVVELKNGSLLFTIRNQLYYETRARIFALSKDGGETIDLTSIQVPETMPDSAEASGMIYLEKYDLVLHSNAFYSAARMNMTLSWSYDEGATWSWSDHLQIWPGPSGYSCLTPIPNRPGYVGLLFEKGPLDGKESTKFVTFTIINLRPKWQKD